MFGAIASWFIPLVAPENQIIYDTQQFYNSALAIVAGAGAATLAFRLLPPLSPALRARRLLALTLRDLRRLPTAPILPTRGRWQSNVYSRLSVLPEQAEPLQRAQLLAALGRNRDHSTSPHCASIHLGVDIEAALEGVAREQSAPAAKRLARSTLPSTCLRASGQERQSNFVRKAASVQSLRPWPDMLPISIQRHSGEIH
jgi:uncharacterized membrane protein YccC